MVQMVSVSTGRVRWLRRIISVPMAQQMAANSIQATPIGRPVRRVNSPAVSRPMVTATQNAARATRRVRASPRKTTLMSTVQIGMVNPRMAARPEASSRTPRTDAVCQPSILGAPMASTAGHSARRGTMRRPRARYQA